MIAAILDQGETAVSTTVNRIVGKKNHEDKLLTISGFSFNNRNRYGECETKELEFPSQNVTVLKLANMIKS